MTDRASLTALRNMIAEVETLISTTTPLPENRTPRSLELLRAALALHFAYYNLCRIHRSLRVTPAMEAGITDHVWTLRELLQG